MTAKDIWQYDSNKLEMARTAGFTVLVIWESDYLESENKQNYIKEKLNEYERIR